MTFVLRVVAICHIILFAGLALPFTSAAQVTLRLFVVPNPSPYLAEWKGHPEYVQLTIINTSTSTIDGQLEVELSVNNDVVARSKPGQPPPIQVPPGTRTLMGTEIVNMEDLTFFGNAQRVAISTGMLPAGRYTYCVRMRNRATGQLVSADCRPLTIEASRRPVLILPANQSVLPAMVRPLFRWNPPQPVPARSIDYLFTLVEMMPGQRSALDAFRTNRPIFQRSYPRITQLPLPVELPSLDTGKVYVWSVQAVFSDTRQPAAQPDGWAEPFTFRVVGLGRAPTDVIPDKPIADGGGRTPSGGDTTGRGGNNNQSSGGGTQGGSGGGSQSGTGGSTEQTQGKPLTPRDTTSCGSCTTPVIAPGGVLEGNLANGDTIRIGHFDLVLESVSNSSPSALAGQGYVRLPFMKIKVAVSFSGLQVNEAKQVTGGLVRSRKDPGATSLATTAADAVVTSITKGGAAAINSLVQQRSKLANMVSEITEPFTTPMGITNVNGFTLAITEFLFTKDQALLAAVASVPIPQYNDTLAFGVTGLQFCPGGLARRGTLELLQDFELRGMTPSSNSFSVTVKAQSDKRQGTYISWACGSFDTLSLDVDVNFPRTWLLPRPDSDPSKRVSASFAAKATDWKNWILRGGLQPCTIPNANGFGMRIDDVVLDMSDVQNAAEVVFPAGYNGDKGVTFTGLFAKNIELFLPDGWRTFSQPDKVPTTAVKNLLIARTGLSATFLATNVMQYPQADLANMSGSIDTISVSLVNSSLTQAFITGSVSLPLAAATQATSLRYKALLNISQKRFDFTIRPADDITTDLFAGAKLKILETSLIAVRLSATEKSFNLNLNGSVGWGNQKITVPGTSKKIDIDLSAKFQNLGFAYDHMKKPTPSSTAGTFNFKPGTWSFASPQKSLAGFPISIKNIAFEQTTPSGVEVAAAQLKFTITVNLDSNKIGGSGTFRIMGAIERTSNSSSFGFAPKFKNFFIDQITVKANLAAVDVDGILQFYNSDPKWGDGFTAGIKATFKSMGLQLQAAARFGRVSGFRYWYVEAKAIMPTGIPFMTGYAFYGAGVAAWYKMNVDMTGAKPSATAAAGSSATSGAAMSPSKNIGLGFSIMAVLGATPDPARLNGDVGISAQFTSSGGISKLGVSGSLFMMASFADRASAPVKGTMNVQYDFVNQIFDLNATVQINRTPITGSGALKVNVNGKSKLWYVKLGDPVTRVRINVNAYGIPVQSRSYFMFGNNIAPPSGFLPETFNGLRAAGCSIKSSMLGSATNSVKTGPGMAVGIEVSFKKSGNVNLGVATIDWAASAGVETNLSLKRVAHNPCSGFTGYNRWYVQGNVAVYGAVSVKLRAKPWNVGGGTIKLPCCANPFKKCFYRLCPHNVPRVCLHCCSGGCTFTLADIKIGAYLDGGFPGPSWVTGSVSGKYNVLGGLIKGSFNANFSQGTQCRP